MVQQGSLRRVLVVHDEPVFTALLTKGLRSLGFAVEIAIVSNFVWNDRWTFGCPRVSWSRFARFNLELNAEKTRLIEFGRFAAVNRQKRGAGKPETFEFLGHADVGTTWASRTSAGRRERDGSRCGARRSRRRWRPSCAR